MRFSLRMMTSGAFSSISFFNRLLRLMTRRYRSLRSEVAKRPPSSGTSGRSSGGMAGLTARSIPSGVWRQQLSKLGRNDRDDVEDHPFRLVGGLPERVDDLQPFGVLQLLLGRR